MKDLLQRNTMDSYTFGKIYFMKKIVTLLVLFFSYFLTAQTGCLQAENGLHPYGLITVYCNNEFQNISTDAKAGTYSNVELSAGRTYTFRSSVLTDFLTLSNAEGTEIILYGTNTIEYIPTTDETLRLYVHLDDQCGSATTYRTMTVRCNPGPDPNDPTEPVAGCTNATGPNSIDYTPYCNGFPEIITDFAFTGSYSPIAVTANTTYTFKSTVPTDYITIANALGTAAIINGIGEVQWTAVADGMIQFQIYLDENCGIGDMDEEPRWVTVQCGEQAPPSEGCLEAPNGQFPVNIFTPACNTTTETVIPMGYTGEYSMIQVAAGTDYIFYSSVATDMITIGNEEGSEVLGYGIGSFEWTADSDALVRFYTHANNTCAMDVFTRRRSVKCGAPFVATEPDFECFQGDGLLSNSYENGLVASQEIPSVADDFVVDGGFTVQQVRLNLFSSDQVPSISLKFLADNNDAPGEAIQVVQNIIPSEQLLIAATNGFFVYQVTLDLPAPLTLTTGKYWLQPLVNFEFGALWEMTSTGTSNSNVQILSPEGVWVPTNFQAVFFVSGECSDLSNGEFNLPEVSFFPNPVKDVITFLSAEDIENVSIFTIAGQLIKEQRLLDKKIVVSDLKSGFYLLKVILITGETETFKIIKE